MKATDCEIVRMIGTLAERMGYDGRPQTLDFNLIKRSGRTVYDLRWWAEGQPLHGLSLTERTLAELGEMIDSIFDMEKHEK